MIMPSIYSKKRQYAYSGAFIAILFVVLPGILLLGFSNAQTSVLSLETENGQMSGGAQIITDSNASKAAAVQFGAAAGLPLAKRISSVGDSITNASNAIGSCCSINKSYSWSTGTQTVVNSHFNRLKTAQPGQTVSANNSAISGSKMSSLATQITTAAKFDPDYITALTGGNDACESSYGAMTSASAFRTQFKAALGSLQTNAPQAKMLIGSVPNVYYLWDNYKSNATAQAIWKGGSVCQSMLSTSNTEANRQAVVTRIKEYNTALKEECAKVAQCKYDNDAVFNHRFSAAEISTADYFHPSVEGQKTISRVLWAAGYWPNK